jgi:3-oxoacyl-[acyl-carrier-protein] synthase II
MKRRRVKITGIGPVTPAGIGREEFWKGILEPVSRIRLLPKLSEHSGALIAAELRDFRPERYFEGVSFKRMARHTQFAVVGALLAIRDAGIGLEYLRERMPLIAVGASLMDFGAINRFINTALVRGYATPAPPTTVFSMSVASIGGAISELVGGTTRTISLQSACCSGVDAIGHAAERIATGEAEIAICGGSEAPLHYHPMVELKLAGLSPGSPEEPDRQCRPFDLWRTSGALGEGAAVFVLEPEESPRLGYAFIDGYAYASDPVENPGAGLVDAIRLTLANAGVGPTDIDAINAWGPGHPVVDAAEAVSLARVFGPHLVQVPAFSIKGAVGSALGAAGAIQVAASALGIRDDRLPPTVNWEYPDPSCPLNLSSNCRFLRQSKVLIDSHGLSGTNACLVLSR